MTVASDELRELTAEIDLLEKEIGELGESIDKLRAVIMPEAERRNDAK